MYTILRTCCRSGNTADPDCADSIAEFLAPEKQPCYPYYWLLSILISLPGISAYRSLNEKARPCSQVLIQIACRMAGGREKQKSVLLPFNEREKPLGEGKTHYA
jgi:hypothetical protein